MFKLVMTKGFNEKQLQVLETGFRWVNAALGDPKYREMILGSESLMTNSEGKRASEILDALITTEFPIKAALYSPKWPWSKVVGYVNGDGWIYMSTRYYDDIPGVGANLVHETLHVPLGFKHPKYGFTRREVNYFFGDRMEALLKTYEPQVLMEMAAVLA